MVWFEIALVGLTFFTGLVWLLDKLWLRKRREQQAGILDAKEPVLVDYSRAFFPVLAAVLCQRSFVAEPFRIPSSSMIPRCSRGSGHRASRSRSSRSSSPRTKARPRAPIGVPGGAP